jgi:hypothetical protein
MIDGVTVMVVVAVPRMGVAVPVSATAERTRSHDQQRPAQPQRNRPGQHRQPGVDPLGGK